MAHPTKAEQLAMVLKEKAKGWCMEKGSLDNIMTRADRLPPQHCLEPHLLLPIVR